MKNLICLIFVLLLNACGGAMWARPANRLLSKDTKKDISELIKKYCWIEWAGDSAGNVTKIGHGGDAQCGALYKGIEASEHIKKLLGKNEYDSNFELARILADASLMAINSIMDGWDSALRIDSTSDVNSNWQFALHAVGDVLSVSGSSKLLNDSFELLVMIAARENDPTFSDFVASIGVMVYLATNPMGSFVTYNDMVRSSKIDYRKNLIKATIKDKAKALGQQ